MRRGGGGPRRGRTAVRGSRQTRQNRKSPVTQYFQLHPSSPPRRLISQSVAILRSGGLIVYPTDSCYAFGCCIGNREAMDQIRRVRQVGPAHHFTLACRDLSELASYARVHNSAFRLLKALTPGPYTFILKATREVPRRLQHPRRKTIGLRVPDNRIVKSLLDDLGEPLMSSTMLLPGDRVPISDPFEIRERLEGEIALLIDGGNCGIEPTTVLDLTDEAPIVVRVGLGSLAGMGLVDA